MKSLFATALLSTFAAANQDHFAVLVAGSSGWWNYRHQADIHHQQLAVCGKTRSWPMPVPDNHSLFQRGPVDHPPALRRRASSSIRAATVFAS